MNKQPDVVVTTTPPTMPPRIFPTVADVIMPMLDVPSLIHLGATSKDMLSKFVREVVESRVPKIKQEISRLVRPEPDNLEVARLLLEPNNNLEGLSYPRPPSPEDVDKAFTLEQEGLDLVDSNLSICQKYHGTGFASLSSLRKWFQYHPGHDYEDNAAANEMLPLLPRIFYRSNLNDNVLDRVMRQLYMSSLLQNGPNAYDRTQEASALNFLMLDYVNPNNDLDTTLSWSSTTSSSYDSFVGWVENGETRWVENGDAPQVELRRLRLQRLRLQRLRLLLSCAKQATLAGRVEVFRVNARRCVWESLRRQHENNILQLDPYMYLLTKMDEQLAGLAIPD